MPLPIVTIENITIDFGSSKLFDSINATINEQDKITLIGRNGSGKSTLLKLIAKKRMADEGNILFKQGIKPIYLPQEPEFDKEQKVVDFIHEIDVDFWQVQALFDELNIDENALFSELSGGQIRKVFLALTFAQSSDLLLLDEPTNHLDINTILWLENKLKAYNGTVILITHDRRFAENTTNKCLWLDHSSLYLLDIPLNQFEDWQEKFFDDLNQQKLKADKLIKEETRWSREGISARRKRNQGRLRRLVKLKEVRANMVNRKGDINFEISSIKKTSKEIIKMDKINYGWNNEPLIIKNFTDTILNGDRIGIVGKNGIGKSTLLKIMIGQLKPKDGFVKIGNSVEPLWIDQNRSNLDANKTLWEVLTPKGGDHVIVAEQSVHVATYAEEFLFDKAQLRSPISSLSGGEKNRLALAIELKKPTNFIILDEPTNDLDYETLNLLADKLNSFKGTLIIVSHDRDFLDQLVNKCYFFEGAGVITPYAGNYSDAIAQGAKLNFDSDNTKKKKQEKVDSKKTDKKSPPKKLSYKYQRAYELLPKEIEQLEKSIKKLELELSEDDLFNKDNDKFLRLSNQLQEQLAAKITKEDELLEIEIMLEEIENE